MNGNPSVYKRDEHRLMPAHGRTSFRAQRRADERPVQLWTASKVYEISRGVLRERDADDAVETLRVWFPPLLRELRAS